MTLQSKIFAGLVAGIAVGAASKVAGLAPLHRAVLALEPLGTVFIRLISMVVVPLVIASLFVGVASLGDVRRLGRIGGKTLAYFLGTTMVAATLGLTVARVMHLGAEVDASERAALTNAFAVQGEGVAQAAAKVPTTVQTLVEMVPQNPFASAAAGDLLPLIIAVCIFAAAATVTRGGAADNAASDASRDARASSRTTVIAFFAGVNDLAMVVIGWLMRPAPVAVFVLIAATVAKSGTGVLRNLALYTVTVIGALALHVATTQLLVVRAGARLGVAAFFRSVSDALLLAFSTASSSATLPVSMAAARTRLGIPDEIVSFVLPAGATLNKNGAAVYKAVTAVFIAQLYGVALGPAQFITIVVASTMASFAGAGVPGSSLITTLIVLNAIGLGPQAAAGIALVAGIDRPLDMCRTTVNTIGNLAGAAWIARSEGVLGVTRPGPQSGPALRGA
jgi:Na+/H+-dicarboxylate symporter